MTTTFLPRLGNATYRVEPIPAPFFNGADVGLGIQVTVAQGKRGAALASLQQSMRAVGSVRAGRIDLPDGPFVAFSMPRSPEAAALRLGWSKSALRRESNQIDLSDGPALHKRFTRFVGQDLRSFSPEILATNLHGATVRQTAFGRSFKLAGDVHSEWETHKDGHSKAGNGRAPLFLRAETSADWDMIARNFLGELNRNEVAKFSQTDLEAMIDIARVDGAFDIEMTDLRERIEAEIAFTVSRSHLVGRDIASRISTGFPNHEVKTGTKRFFAQFSTPPAVGEVAAEFLQPEGKRILEPTVGNGVLAAASAGRGAEIVGLEIDDGRAYRAARALDGSDIFSGDATIEDQYPNGEFDALLANPPFKKLDEPQRIPLATFPADRGSGVFPAKTQQAAILVHSINRLREHGDAVFVMPAERNDPTILTGEKVQIQNMLFGAFRDVQTVALDARLYQSMGSNFPVLVHFCRDRFADGEGRDPATAAETASARFPRPSNRTFERQDSERATLFIPAVNTFEAFYAFADNNVLTERFAPSVVAGRSADVAIDDPAPQEPIETETDRPTQGRGEGAGPGSSSLPAESVASPTPQDAPVGPERAAEASDGTSGGVRRQEGPSDAQVEPEAPAGPEWDVLDTSDWGLPVWYVDDLTTDEFTTPYIPMSKNVRGAKTVIERTMAAGTSTALQRAALNIPDNIDKYVADRIGVTEDEILSADGPLSPEQIDSLALGFQRAEVNKASIIGDQMGVGKGRQLAAHAINALRTQGRPVLFMTNRENLFTDFAVRDLADVSGESFEDLLRKDDQGLITPFIMNAHSVIKDGGRVIVSSSPADNKLAKQSESLTGYNLVMSSYSQVQIKSGAWRARALKNWITESAEMGTPPVLLLDEVHKAAGPDSRTGMVIRGVIDHALAHNADIVYSSATSVKSGKNLPVYAPALPDTGLSNAELMLTIDKMPLAVQEILSSEMARSGSLIERKMSDAGVDRDIVKLADLNPEKMQSARAASDKVSYILQDMQAMAPEIRTAAKAQFRRMAGGAAASGSLDKLQVDTTSPATQLDAFSRYLMGSVKGMFTDELMVDAVVNNQKATIVSEYTGNSVAEWLIQKHGAGRPLVGDREIAVPAHPHMGHVLERFAERMLVVKGTDAYGEKIEFRIEGFDGWLEDIRADIDNAGLEDLRINIFDRVRQFGDEIGQRVEDISGRSIEFVETDGEIRARRRAVPNPIDAADAFNNGRIDVLCFNNSAATGISLQNSPRHGSDLRRRSMIKMAFQKEITDERQVEGRINRTGQLAPPRYVIPETGFAADDRIANLFNRANRNLTSSTSATRDNKTNAKHVVDILNPVGEMAVASVLENNPHVAQILAINPEGTDLARKLLGRSIMLPLEEQGEILAEVDTAFRLFDEKLTAEGRNPLKLGRYDWRAKVQLEKVLLEGNPASESISAQPLVLNKVSYEEELVFRPPDAVERQLLEGVHKREETGPFKSLEEVYGYKSAIVGGSPDLENKLFDDVMGRASDGMRTTWRTEIPVEVGQYLNGRMERALRSNRKRNVQYNAPYSSDEVRAASEFVANALIDDERSNAAVFFAAQTSKDGDPVYEDFNFPLAIRSLYDRERQIKAMGDVSELLVPGALISLDRRAVANYVGGAFSRAYDEAGSPGGYLPAVVTSVRFAKNAPFVTSKMSVSFVVPGGVGTESATLSSLRTGMSFSGLEDQRPIRPFLAFANDVTSSASASGAGRMGSADESLVALEALYGRDGLQTVSQSLRQVALDRTDSYRSGNFDGIGVLDAGGGIDPFGRKALYSIYDSLPKQVSKRLRYTLEGNAFAGMAAISMKTGGALGEKVIYTDDKGQIRNALLLNKMGTGRIIKQVEAKVTQRATPLPKLKTAEQIGDYLAASAAVLWDRSDTVSEMWPDGSLARALSLGADGDLPTSNSAETLFAVRSQALSAVRSFPLSISVGGDPWAWQAEQYRKQEAKSGSKRHSNLAPGTSSLTFEGEPGERSGRRPPAITHDETSVRLILSNVASDQMVAVHSGPQQAALIFKQSHEILKDNTFGAALVQRSSDKFDFFYSEMSLTKGVLAIQFDLRDADERRHIGEILSHAAIQHRGEVLGAGMARDVNLASSLTVSLADEAVKKEASALTAKRSVAELETSQSEVSSILGASAPSAPSRASEAEKETSSIPTALSGPVR